jgi:putative membrane protein
MTWFFLFKSLHFIGLVSWFAALFYLPRLFIYHTEALDKTPEEQAILCPQFILMADKLYRIIMNPAMMFTFVAGLGMIAVREYETQGQYLRYQPWLRIKLLLLLGLLGYHLYCKRILLALAQGKALLNSIQLRLFNEIATLFLLAIVLLAVYKNVLNFFYAAVAILVTGIVLFLAVRWYKKYRMKQQAKSSSPL